MDYNPNDESEDYTSDEVNDPEERDSESVESSSLWDSGDAVESLKMERALHPEEDEVALAKRLFTEAMPNIAVKMVNLALYATNDNTALAAGKYITDLVVLDQSGSTKAKWEELLGEAISDAELHANSTSPGHQE